MTGHNTHDSFPVDGWHSATGCGPDGGNCVEVNLAARDAAGEIDMVGIRDSKRSDGVALAFPVAGWQSFRTSTIMDNIRA